MFFIIRIRTSLEGAATKSIYEHGSYTSALQQYFSLLSGDIGDAGLKENLCMLISGTGNVVEKRYFDHTEEE